MFAKMSVVGGVAALMAVTHEEAKIVIVDDHELARESIRSMLESEPHLQVLAEATDGQESLELCRLQHPDLVLMDVGMPKVNGFEATQIIKAELPTTKVLMVSAHFDPFLVSEVERVGADGYVTELCTVQELVDAIRGVLRGESHYPSVPRDDHPRQLVSKPLPCPLPSLLARLILSLAYSKIALCSKTMSSCSRLISVTFVAWSSLMMVASRLSL